VAVTLDDFRWDIHMLVFNENKQPVIDIYLRCYSNC
jgi:hypothetical protein